MGIKKTRRLGPTSTAVEFCPGKAVESWENTDIRGINDHGRDDCGPAETADIRRDAGTAFFCRVPGGTGPGEAVTAPGKHG